MYSMTDYREGRVVVLAKDFPDVGSRIDFVRGRTSDEDLNRVQPICISSRQHSHRIDCSHGPSQYVVSECNEKFRCG